MGVYVLLKKSGLDQGSKSSDKPLFDWTTHGKIPYRRCCRSYKGEEDKETITYPLCDCIEQGLISEFRALLLDALSKIVSHGSNKFHQKTWLVNEVRSVR